MDTFPNTEPKSPSERAATEYALHSADARAGVEDVAAQGSAAVERGAERARAALTDTTDQAAEYVQAQPLKSLLIAAAAGAAIALLARAVGKHHGHR